MKIEIDLNECFDGSFIDQIQDAAVERAAHLLMNELRTEMRSKVAASVSVEIDKEVAEMIKARCNELIYETDWSGRPVGEPKTLAMVIAERFEKKMGTVKDSYDRRNITVTQAMIAEFAIAGLEKQAKDSLAAINAQAKERVNAAIKEIVANQLQKM